jgi:hypothetical protein
MVDILEARYGEENWRDKKRRIRNRTESRDDRVKEMVKKRLNQEIHGIALQNDERCLC